MILSQLFRGFTKQIKYLDRLTTRDVAAGFKKAVDTAYKAVMKPKEGTILTVAKAAADPQRRQTILKSLPKMSCRKPTQHSR